MDDNKAIDGLDNAGQRPQDIANRKMCSEYRAKRQRDRDRVWEDLRTEHRRAYRLKKEEAGGTVRDYRSMKKEPRLTGESEEDFKRRMKRERERERRGVSAATVRPYTDLSSLTPDQKTRRKAEQAAERKRQQRARKKVEDIDNLDPEELQAISAALDELDAV